MSRQARPYWFPVLVVTLLLAAATSCQSGRRGEAAAPRSVPELLPGTYGPGGAFLHRFAAVDAGPPRAETVGRA